MGERRKNGAKGPSSSRFTSSIAWASSAACSCLNRPNSRRAREDSSSMPSAAQTRDNW